MKKLLLSTLSVAAFAVGSVQAQVAQIPLVEHFTQASCAPCASQNPAMKTTLDNFGTAGTNWVRISHQVSWPGVDPMNASFPAGPNDRRTHYGVTGVPATSLNGTATSAPNTEVTTASLTSAAALMTPYQIVATQTWNSASDLDLDIAVTNTTGSAVSLANKIYITMMEDHVIYSSAPGSNGETEFEFVMREMYNATSGATGATTGAALGSIAAGATVNFNLNLTSLPSYIADLNQVSFAVYLGDDAATIGTPISIYQAAKTTPGNVPGLLDVATSTNSTVGAGYCNLAFNPVINLVNNHATIAVTSAVVEYDIDGGTPVQQTFTGNLTTGQSTVISFPATNLNSGTSTVNYNVVSINGGNAYSPGTVAMASETYAKLAATASTADVAVTFDGLALGTPAPTGALADNPGNIRAYSVDNTISTAVTWNLGGFGNSNGCFRWDYYDVTSGGTSKLIWGKLDLSSKTNYELTFSHAHAEYSGGEPDQLKVNVSTDCGATWTTVWDKTGAALSTVAPLGSGRYYPGVADWIANTVDLSAYDGTSELVIAFEGISGYGNSLYVDDINTGSSTGLDEAAQGLDNVTVMPNPVVNNMTVNFTTENSEANILIRNVQGQTVKNISENTVKGANTIEINTTELSAGVYFLTITSDSNVSTKRFVVNK
jgi:hypothetical protein